MIKPIRREHPASDAAPRGAPRPAAPSLETSTLAILESISELIVHQDTEHHILWANRAAAESVNSTAKALRGRCCYEVWHGRQAPCVDCPVSEVLRTGRPARAEIQTPDGRWWSLQSSPVRDAEGRVVGAVEAAQEVSERKRAEERAQRLLEQQITVNRLAQALGESTDLAASYGLLYEQVRSLMDADAFYLAFVNQETGLIRVRYAVLDGEAQVVDGWPPMAQDRDGDELVGRVLRSGEPLYIANLGDPPKRRSGRRAVGTELRAARSLFIAPMKIRGETVGVMQLQSARPDAYTADDRELLDALANVAAIAIQNARLFSEARTRAERLALVNRIARAVGAVLQLDVLLETVYHEVSPIFRADAFFIALYDAERHELDFRLRIDEGAREPVERAPLGEGFLSRVISEGRPLLIRDLPRERANLPQPIRWGTMKVPESWLGVPMRVSDRVIGVIGVQAYRPHAYGEEDQALLATIADQVAVAVENARLYEAVQQELTERQRLEDQLRQSHKMEAIGRLAGGVAHDFNNLLTVINGYSQLVLGSLKGTDPLHADVQEIRQAGERAAALTRQLLAFSRRQVLEMRSVNLNEVIEGMGKMLRRIIGEDVTLQLELAPGLGEVKADVGQIEQVIINLAANARDAMPEGGTLTLQTSNITLDESAANRQVGLQAGRYARLTITDTGLGMSAEVKKHIFEPFFTTKELGHGTGLGLATVYGIIKQFGGGIEVESEPGQGASFGIYLPHIPEQSRTTATEHRRPHALPRGSETILVVEDEDEVRKLAVRLLRRLGYTVFEAANAPAAYELVCAHQAQFDLVLTDVVMPQMSGPELAERLYAEWPALRVLYMSGYTRSKMHRGPLHSAIRMVQKPFAVEQLAQQVRQALDEPRPGRE